MYDVKLVAITQNMRRETGWSIRKIASIMNVPKSTTARWLQGSPNE
jgi:DNA-binding transcriptional regulator YiaG